ncbi:hypothetical protein P0Y35_14485 [Kiritimatiellaeota bacterium B1221]|nr:hypothetical protein [Kiritimatiellaeota bacterium B1221]
MSKSTLFQIDQGKVQGRGFWLSLSISLLGYYLLFSYVLHKPQTVGYYRDLYAVKIQAMEESGDRQKIVILAGSNGRASHSAKIVEEVTGITAINMSQTASLSIDYQLSKIKPYLHPNDIIYMPLEYGQLTRSKRRVQSGKEAPYAVAYDKASMRDFTPYRKLRAHMYFDLKFCFSSVVEMYLSHKGFKRRISADNLNRWGDQTDHSVERAKKYIDYISAQDGIPSKPIKTKAYSAQLVSEFLTWAKEHGVLVVGGYPTYIEGAELPEDDDQALQNFYVDQGHLFLALDNRGRYPRSHFFDTAYHLCEPYQIEHSQLVAEGLLKLIPENILNPEVSETP